MKVIIYYISGHGYGHFTRSATIMKALLDGGVADRIVARTRVSMDVFEQTLPPHLYYSSNSTSTTSTNSNSSQTRTRSKSKSKSKIIRSEPAYELDAGTVQSSPLDVDPIGTLCEHNRIFHKSCLDDILKGEMEFVSSLLTLVCDNGYPEEEERTNNGTTTGTTTDADTIVAILCDATPIGIEIAHQINVPGILISNFDWCGIYDGFLRHIPSTTTDDNNKEDDDDSTTTTTTTLLFQQECQTALTTANNMYRKATVVIRPRAAVPSPVGYEEEYGRRTRVMDTPWICPEVLRRPRQSDDEVVDKEDGEECGGGTDELDAIVAVQRNRLELALFGDDDDDDDDDGGDCEIRRCIVLVTFGGQPGSVGDNSTNEGTSDDDKLLKNSPLEHPHEEDGNVNEKSTTTTTPTVAAKPILQLGFIFATNDANAQVQIQRTQPQPQPQQSPTITHNNNTNTNTTTTPAITAKQAIQLLQITPTSPPTTIAELTNLCDVVLCKPGYGTICETLASSYGGTTSMVYIRREPDFVEETFLLREFERGGGVGVRLDRSLFEGRRWYDAIEEALEKKVRGGGGNVVQNELTGAEVITEILRKEVMATTI